MSIESLLIGVPYDFHKGPLPEDKLRDWQPQDGANCRRIWQLFAYHAQQEIQPSAAYLCPEAFFQTGYLVATRSQNGEFYKKLEMGDVIFCFRERTRSGTLRNRERIPLEDKIKYLHTAIYLGESTSLGVTEYFPSSVHTFSPDTPLVLHGSLFAGKSVVEPIDEAFLENYTPLVARRTQSTGEVHVVSQSELIYEFSPTVKIVETI